MVTLYLIWRKKSFLIKEKKQAVIFIISLSISSISKIIDDIVITLFYPYKIPGLPSIYLLILTLGIWILIIKYRFLSITPEYVSNDIIKNIDEVVILLDNNGKILIANDKAKSIFKINTITNEILNKIIVNYNKIQDEIKNLLNKKSDAFSERIELIQEGKKILLEAKYSLIKDQYNDIIGILMIAKKIKGIEDFKNIYKITDREFDIILKLISGVMNKDICNDLNISLNTIKRHINNIYNKLVITNKVELINFLKNHEII